MFVSERIVVTDWGPLGEVLAAEASRENQANVGKLAGRAKDLLKLVRETFPTYTLHDEQHAENVIALMGKLAAPRIDQMRPLEAALLILAAYFHDAGMAYTAEEIAAIADEDEFRSFLDGDDEAFVATERNSGDPPPGVIERYCRARHADRVWTHLEDCDPSWLRWGAASIIEPLALICRSHNEPATALNEERFKKDYRKADLRFCAIMLRLADILDFDQSRAPRVIYDHLGLARHGTPEAATSDAEWQKHLAAGGFEFPENPHRGYSLQFVAGPTNPGVEHDLRSFLEVVREELLQCRAIADNCDDRWRTLPLPAEIDTSTITSHGYKYGEFRFELDRTAVLELFTGERLYDDPYAFLRELLQNAFDAINARKHLFGHESAGVRVNCWEDAGGYVWVRVDDDGIGMDEDALRRYFLRIGRSYYRSPEFEADVARRGLAERSFGAISRFGIGVLACFMVGDQVELSSRRHPAPGRTARAIRLSINRRDDYFVLQEQGRRGTPMPGRNGDEDAFLRTPGTHIAIRIDPNRAAVDLETAVKKVESYVFAPPVPVFVNAKPVGQETTSRMTSPLLAGPDVRTFDVQTLRQASDDLIPNFHEIRIAAIPLDIGHIAECPEIQGQLVAYVPLIGVDEYHPRSTEPQESEQSIDTMLVTKETRRSMSHQYYASSHSPVGLEIHIWRTYERTGVEHAYRRLTGMEPSPLRSEDEGFDEPPPEPVTDFRSATLKLIRSPYESLDASFHIDADGLPLTEMLSRERDEVLEWSYNGIALPTKRDDNRPITSSTENALIFGTVGLSGTLRPDLDISRSNIRAVPFSVHSSLQLAIRHAFYRAVAGDDELAVAASALPMEEMIDVPPGEPAVAATIAADLNIRKGHWNREAVIESDGEYRSVDELKSSARAGELHDVSGHFHSWEEFRYFYFYQFLATGLLHLFVDLEMVVHSPKKWTLRVRSDGTPQLPDGSQHYAPLFAVDFRTDEKVARIGWHLNARHPLACWLNAHADTLSTDFPAPFHHVFRRANRLEKVEEINTALDRVARSKPEIAAPPAAYLREDENGWWWSR